MTRRKTIIINGLVTMSTNTYVPAKIHAIVRIKSINLVRDKVTDAIAKLLGPKDDYAIPTMDEMGYDESTTSIRGGTDEAHNRLDLFLSQPDKVATFSKPKTAPTSLEPSTTMLSPYMKFGCIGVREIWWGCKEVVKNWKGKGETKEPENMFGQVGQDI
jgi:cryptochrome